MVGKNGRSINHFIIKSNLIIRETVLLPLRVLPLLRVDLGVRDELLGGGIHAALELLSLAFCPPVRPVPQAVEARVAMAVTAENKATESATAKVLAAENEAAQALQAQARCLAKAQERGAALRVRRAVRRAAG